MKNLLLITSLFALTAHAQSLDPNDPNSGLKNPSTNDHSAVCADVAIEAAANGQITLYKLSDKDQPAIRVGTLESLGKDLVENGIDVQTSEPKDWVVIQPSQTQVGKFQLVLRDHLAENAPANVDQYVRINCNDNANEILTSAHYLGLQSQNLKLQKELFEAHGQIDEAQKLLAAEQSKNSTKSSSSFLSRLLRKLHLKR